MTKALRAFILIVVGWLFFLAAMNAMARKGDIRVFDLKYEKFEFFNGDVIVELPDKPRREITALYYKVLMDQAMSLVAGHSEISVIRLNKYAGPMEDKFKSKLVVEKETDNDKDGLTVYRYAFWYGKVPIVFALTTGMTPNTRLAPADRDARIAKDDEIFEHIVESFRYRKEDGTYAKPEIVRQPDEVKDASQK